ncbi:MAG: cob(I)yrinic acid a,c-diamide adenosyltransferase [Candidatus Diapherotrites archaeon CG11_big_fil_rev_8_21_14_0_20_37_9]|nr:MAG: cob(I)yrinic acid a,c-diamide adenosyltransferase [Candidatus Diapherotrites archaeon CG11_big_fil_rev_8_21_14_0_20_37_9]
MKKLGLVQVYWGNGKGKTTAALGLIARALGRNLTVCLIQFMKSGIENNADFEEPGEIKILKKIDGFSYKRFGTKKWVIGKPDSEHIKEAKKAVEFTLDAISLGKFNLVIVDEILYAIQLGLISEEKVIEIIDAKAKETELVLTGSHKAYPKIFEKADMVSEVRKVKHPFDKGIMARKGIEY